MSLSPGERSEELKAVLSQEAPRGDGGLATPLLALLATVSPRTRKGLRCRVRGAGSLARHPLAFQLRGLFVPALLPLLLLTPNGI